jgi:hypothetical protein
MQTLELPLAHIHWSIEVPLPWLLSWLLLTSTAFALFRVMSEVIGKTCSLITGCAQMSRHIQGQRLSRGSPDLTKTFGVPVI